MFDGMIEWSKILIAENGMWMLAIFSYTEAIFHPIPVDPILIFLREIGSWNVYQIFFVAWASSILGGGTAYYLGQKLGKPVFLRFFGDEWFKKGKNFLEKYGVWSIIIAAVTPLPFKVAAWMSGILHMPFWKFFIAQAIGRGIRFGIVLGLWEVIRSFFL
jgi:membrane protein YqaA with SNARE-associated domain